MTGNREPARRATIAVVAAAAAVTSLLGAAGAQAHVERASYWPDPAAETVGGQPTGGEVPAVRSLASALNAAAVGDTRVVCDGGEPLAYRADQQVSRRPDLAVSRARVGRLEAKLRRLRRAVKRASGSETDRGKAHAVRLKGRLTQAKLDYRAALAVERLAREGGQKAYEEALAAEQASRQTYASALASQPSMAVLDASIAAARTDGYEIRPSEPRSALSGDAAATLHDLNARLLADCEYDAIQPAVSDSGNNDRVVVMPGVYTEPTSRAQPTNDPACDGLEEQNDRGQTGANSYRYVATCPNDQQLIAVVGRVPGPAPPQPPLDDRHGIPDTGACARCNLQIEGSGVGADDVVVDAGRVESGNGAPEDPAKDVGIRADRADGFVLRKMTVRHAREHGIYVHEVDGYLLDEFKAFHNMEYGVLTFTSDHGLMQDCEGAGSGDSGLYPGSAPDTQAQVSAPDHERYNTEIRRCDMHHNTGGYSGTDANAVWVHDNDFYDNALGFTTDVFTAAGHPGFPQDSDLIEDNEFYSNNFNPYVAQPEATEVAPSIPVPVGTGMWIAGGNSNEIRNNHFWDNWRRGTMLFAVPDSFVCGPDAGNAQNGCDPTQISTSYDNEYHGNVMGLTPGGAADPNGVDFWWDQFAGNTGNCWHDNVGPDGTRASLATDPPISPVPNVSLPTFLPEDCATSAGTGGDNEVELVSCLANFDEGAPTPCSWFTTPVEPQP